MNRILKTASEHWRYMKPLLSIPQNEKEYDKLVFYLDELLDIVGDDEDHELIGLVDLISNMIYAYDQIRLKKTRKRGIHALKFLMVAQGLKQSDFSEIASQGVMSEVLSGKRELNLRQIKYFARYFHVNPETFID